MARKVIAAVAVYMVIGFATMGYFDAQRFAICDPIHQPGVRRGACYMQNAYQAVWLGMFWPVSVPFSVGGYVARVLTDS